MSLTPEDESIETTIRAELEEGQVQLAMVGISGTTIRMHRHPRTDRMLFEVGARYSKCSDRDVYAIIEVDPARRGWRLEATLNEYPDTEAHDREIRGLGGARVEEVDSAIEHARALATAAWIAVRDYVLSGCHDSKVG